jgi:PAS domain S-box-containing protein
MDRQIGQSIERIGALGLAPRDVLEALLSSIPDAVYVVDHDGRVAFANPAALTLLGYEESELLGAPSHATIHHHRPDGTPFPEQECPLLRPRRTGETVRVDDDCFWRRDGSSFRVAYSSAPLEIAGRRGAIVVFRDATARLRAEQAALREAAQRARAEEIHASRARLVAAADAERRRIGRDLHDGAQQRLVTTLIHLQLAEEKWESAPQRARELLALALADARLGMADLREIVAGIHPAILTQRGLGAAVDSLAARLPIPVELDVPDHRLPAAIELSVYFFCSEALTNVVKHARASSAWVRVELSADRCTVQVGDDGTGGARPRGQASGLTGLRDRIGALGGTVDIASPPAGGTVLTASIPL